MFKKIKRYSESPKVIEILFISLLLSLPFGSSILSFSIGFMTIYPYLILLGILSLLSVFHVSKITSKIEKYFLIFLLFWIAYSLFLLYKSPGIKDAIIDIRSLFLMFLTSWIILFSKYILGIEKWKKSLHFSFIVIFFLMFLFALFENMFGVHFSGAFIENISKYYPNSDAAFAPVFLLDNPNNLVAYLVLLSVLIILTNNKLKQQPLFILLLIIADLIISIFADSRIGIFTSVFMLLSFLILYLKIIINKLKNSNKKYYIFSVVLLFLIVFIQKDKTFLGKQEATKKVNILGKNTTSKTNLHFVLTDNVNDKNLDSLNTQLKSNSIRYSLILNGFDLTKKSNYLGVGPGQYRYIHKNKGQKYYTKTIISPHFWLIEIIAQFGVLILLLYLSIFLWIVYLSIKYYKKNIFLTGTILISILVFFLASIMPSAFLILDINWLFLAILIGIVSNFKEQTT